MNVRRNVCAFGSASRGRPAGPSQALRVATHTINRLGSDPSHLLDCSPSPRATSPRGSADSLSSESHPPSSSYPVARPQQRHCRHQLIFATAKNNSDLSREQLCTVCSIASICCLQETQGHLLGSNNSNYGQIKVHYLRSI